MNVARVGFRRGRSGVGVGSGFRATDIRDGVLRKVGSGAGEFVPQNLIYGKSNDVGSVGVDAWVENVVDGAYDPDRVVWDRNGVTRSGVGGGYGRLYCEKGRISDGR